VTVALGSLLAASPGSAQTCAPSPPSDGGCGGVPAGSACIAPPGMAGTCFQAGGDGSACQCVATEPAPALGAWGRLGAGALVAMVGALTLSLRARRRTLRAGQ